MFDIGFGELLIIFVLALLVFGPEKLPGMARTLGSWAGRGKAFMRNLSEQLDEEVNHERLKKALESKPSSESRERSEPRSVAGAEPFEPDDTQDSGDDG
jgi:sec-independent protein translocase protein TatB